jgi:hypothetical protein
MTRRTHPLLPGTLEQLTLDTEPWLSCDDCFRHVDEFVELVLAGAAERMPAMSVHLRACPACIEEAETVLVLAAEDTGVGPAEALARLAALTGH